jgi:hypothetical protein
VSYLKPVRFAFTGDKKVAQKYLREARRVVYILLERLPKDPLPAGRKKVKLHGDVTVEVIIAGLDVTAIIHAPPPKEKLPRTFDDFVVFPRNAANHDGVYEFPEEILRPPGDKTPWRTFFYDMAHPVYEDFAGSKGTYKNDYKAMPLFPDGIRHAGNIDWRGPDGERLSWYGPENRYWYDTYRQPSAQYGKFVFNLGQALLDVDLYCTENAVDFAHRLVVGACIREHDDGRWLYVMMTDMPDLDIPPYDIPSYTVYFSESYPQYTVNFTLRRFKLVKDELTTEAQKYSVVDGTAQDLWAASAWRACNPWVFNREGTKMTTFALGSPPLFTFSTSNSDTLAGPPPETMDRIDVDLTDPLSITFATTAPSMPAGGGPATMALDYDDEGQPIEIALTREPFMGSPHALLLLVGTTKLPLWYKEPSPGYDSMNTRRAIVWMDARAQFVVVDEYRLRTSTPGIPSGPYTETMSTVIFFQGQEVARMEYSTTGGPSGGFDLNIGALESCASVAVAPLAWVWMLSGVASIGVMRASVLGLVFSQRIPYVVSETFGQFGARSAVGSPSNAISASCTEGLSNQLQDLHGRRFATGAAARDGIIVLSTRLKGLIADPVSPDTSAFYVTGNSLPTLAGVSGTSARYHLIWLLGQPIGGEELPIARL